MDFVRAEGVEGKAAVAMADLTAMCLYKAMKVKIWR